jgi:hypothetical protein
MWSERIYMERERERERERRKQEEREREREYAQRPVRSHRLIWGGGYMAPYMRRRIREHNALSG